jgi:TolB protein
MTRKIVDPWIAAAALAIAGPAFAQTPDAATPPDESALGTLHISGSGDTALPKLAVMPIVTTNDADTTLQIVVKKDLDLSGQFDVLDDGASPPGLFLHDSPVDTKPWEAKGVQILVRVLANRLESDRFELRAAAYFTSRGNVAVFQNRIETGPSSVRAAAHRVTDALLGALTGRPGGFASHLLYGARVGANRQVFGIDADGFNLHAESPAGDTAIAPAFGPNGQVYYALSHDYSPFRLVRGRDADPVPISVQGSVFGLGFSPDHTKLAVSVAAQETSRIYTGRADGSDLSPLSTAALANHPVFGPSGKIAYVAGGTSGQRVYVDGRPISPPGFNASAPVFCDTPNGVLVVFTVGVGNGADLVSTDTRGQGIARLTQNQGANSYPACSPDGRLLAFFSTRKTDKGPGLYVVPLAAMWRARRISGEVGESLRWEALPPQ